MNKKRIILKTNNITKKFGNNTVLKNINIEIKEAECHAIVGENGAGKTTLMNILSGIVKQTSGNFKFFGKNIDSLNIRTGIDMSNREIHQDLALIPTLTVAENIFLSKLKSKFFGIMTDFLEIGKKSKTILQRLGESENIKVSQKVKNLNSSQQQIVEIAKALSENPKLLIMDEPTAALTKKEVKNLYRIINSLIKDGISVIYISHILEEVFKISNSITVLRDGNLIDTKKTKETNINEVIKMMVGRKLNLYKKKKISVSKQNKIILSVENLTFEPLFSNINFDLRKGEILGFSGLVGSGRSEVINAIFGSYGKIKGKIVLKGKEVKIRTPREAMNLGIAMLPEDRRNQGFINTLNIGKNLSLANLQKLSRFGVVNLREENKLIKKYIKLLDIKTQSSNNSIFSLSGGNQQKVVFSKWLATNAEILMVDEPTQGIDVGTKSEIHNILKELAKDGISIILVSSELPEILTLSDRILVMKRGNKSGEINIENATQEKIMYLSTVGMSNKAL